MKLFAFLQEVRAGRFPFMVGSLYQIFPAFADRISHQIAQMREPMLSEGAAAKLEITVAKVDGSCCRVDEHGCRYLCHDGDGFTDNRESSAGTNIRCSVSNTSFPTTIHPTINNSTKAVCQV